ncbi:sensor histidine kinase [Flindersiella endophytica]
MRSLLADLAFVTAATVANLTAVAVAEEPHSKPPDLLAYGICLLMGLYLFGRRRSPRIVLLLSVVTLFYYYSLDYPGVDPTLPLATALYVTMVAGYTRLTVVVIVCFFTLSLVVDKFVFHEPTLAILADAAKDDSLFVVVVLLGKTVLNRRDRLRDAQDRLARLESGQEHDIARRVTEERLRIARDMHDVVAHAISAIAVQAALADDTLKAGHLVQARMAVRSVRAAARKALAEVGTLVGLMRRGDDAGAELTPALGVGDLGTVLEPAREAGLEVEAEIGRTLDTDPLPSAVDLAVYRIVQESLTNALRHARAASVRVCVRREGRDVLVEVVDDGRARPRRKPGTSGNGIVGMTERARSLHGSLEAGPLPSGGFRVYARIPVG